MAVTATLTHTCDMCGAAQTTPLAPFEDDVEVEAERLPDGWCSLTLTGYPRTEKVGNTDRNDRFADLCKSCQAKLRKKVSMRSLED